MWAVDEKSPDVVSLKSQMDCVDERMRYLFGRLAEEAGGDQEGLMGLIWSQWEWMGRREAEYPMPSVGYFIRYRYLATKRIYFSVDRLIKMERLLKRESREWL